MISLRLQGMSEAEAHSIRILGEEDAVGLAIELLLVDDSRLDPLGVKLAPERVDVTDGKPAARLIRILGVASESNLDIIPLQPGSRRILGDERESKALGVIAD